MEQIVIEQLISQRFSQQAIDEIVTRVKELFRERKKESASDVDPIKKEIKELETSVENWMQALGKGINGLDNRIIEAQNKIEFLQGELLRIEAIQRYNEIDSETIYAILKRKKDSLFSTDEDEKKKVLQEYVERIIINPSRDINSLDIKITYRVFNGGGEGTCTPVSKSCHESIYACSLLFKFHLLVSRRQDPSEAISIILANDSENCH